MTVKGCQGSGRMRLRSQREARLKVTADFHKADLQDPAKVDQMLSRCAGELVQSLCSVWMARFPRPTRPTLPNISKTTRWSAANC